MAHRKLHFLIVSILAFLLIAAPVLTASPRSVSAQGLNVVLLVVDDFTGLKVEEVREEQLVAGENCAINIRGQGFAVRGASADTAKIDVPHGNVVYSQIEELWTQAGSPANIKLVKVDTAGLTTDAIAESIRTAVANEPQANYFVINMSFVMIPCEYVETVLTLDNQLAQTRSTRNGVQTQAALQTSRAYIEQTVAPVITERMETIETTEATGAAVEIDPLQALFRELGSRAVPVASAGNFALNYPFFPAAWDEVISVSASNGLGDKPISPWNPGDNRPLLTIRSVSDRTTLSRNVLEQLVSNYGEIMIPGEYAYPNVGTVIGTSFAAPRMSFLMAVYLANVGETQCRQADGTPALAYRAWSNLTLAQAAELYCPSLIPYLPQ